MCSVGYKNNEIVNSSSGNPVILLLYCVLVVDAIDGISTPSDGTRLGNLLLPKYPDGISLPFASYFFAFSVTIQVRKLLYFPAAVVISACALLVGFKKLAVKGVE